MCDENDRRTPPSVRIQEPQEPQETTMRKAHLLCGLCVGVALLTGVDARDAGVPPTRIAPVTDAYHGVTVVDPYRWLENGTDPEVRTWTSAQTAHTRAYLDG